MTTNKIDQSNPSKPTQTSWLNRAGNLAMVVGGVAAGAVAFGTGGAAVAAAGGLLYSGYRAFVQKGDDKLVVEATDQGLKLQFNSPSLQINVEEEEPTEKTVSMNNGGTVVSTKYEKAYKITIIDALTSNVSKFKLFGEDILKGFGLASQTKQTGSIKGALVAGQQLDLRKLFDAIQAISSKFTGNKINAHQIHLLTFNNNSSILLNVSPLTVINNFSQALFLINQGFQAPIQPEQIVAQPSIPGKSQDMNVDTGPLTPTSSPKTDAPAISDSTGSTAPQSKTPKGTGATAMSDLTSLTAQPETPSSPKTAAPPTPDSTGLPALQPETPTKTDAQATPDSTVASITTSTAPPASLSTSTPTAGAPETAKNENKSWWKSVTNWIDSVIGFFRNLVSMFWP